MKSGLHFLKKSHVFSKKFAAYIRETVYIYMDCISDTE